MKLPTFHDLQDLRRQHEHQQRNARNCGNAADWLEAQAARTDVTMTTVMDHAQRLLGNSLPQQAILAEINRWRVSILLLAATRMRADARAATLDADGTQAMLRVWIEPDQPPAATSSNPKPEACTTCGGRGEVGGFACGAAPGYETQLCPECKGASHA